MSEKKTSLTANATALPRLHLLGTLVLMLVVTLALASFYSWRSKEQQQAFRERITQTMAEQQRQRGLLGAEHGRLGRTAQGAGVAPGSARTQAPAAAGGWVGQQQQGRALLEAKRRLDPLQFESMYQGHPSSREGLLYGLNFAEYDDLPHEIVRRGNYTDTADTGDDYLCSLSYAVDADGVIYITDAVYSREPMEATEPLVGDRKSVV